MTSRRKPDWFSSLYSTIKVQGKIPLVWGESDCLCQVADGVLAMTGIDYAAEFRGKYSSYQEALDLLKEKGFDSPEEFIIQQGHPVVNVIDAQDGDVGAIEVELEDHGTVLAFGQFLGSVLYIQTERGKGKLPRSRAIKAYRVE